MNISTGIYLMIYLSWVVLSLSICEAESKDQKVGGDRVAVCILVPEPALPQSWELSIHHYLLKSLLRKGFRVHTFVAASDGKNQMAKTELIDRLINLNEGQLFQVKQYQIPNLPNTTKRCSRGVASTLTAESEEDLRGMYTAMYLSHQCRKQIQAEEVSAARDQFSIIFQIHSHFRFVSQKDVFPSILSQHSRGKLKRKIRGRASLLNPPRKDGLVLTQHPHSHHHVAHLTTIACLRRECPTEYFNLAQVWASCGSESPDPPSCSVCNAFSLKALHKVGAVMWWRRVQNSQQQVLPGISFQDEAGVGGQMKSETQDDTSVGETIDSEPQDEPGVEIMFPGSQEGPSVGDTLNTESQDEPNVGGKMEYEPEDELSVGEALNYEPQDEPNVVEIMFPGSQDDPSYKGAMKSGPQDEPGDAESMVPANGGPGGSQLRVAVCYSGHLRGFKQTWPSQREFLIKPLQDAGLQVSVFYASNNDTTEDTRLDREGTSYSDGPVDVETEFREAVTPAVSPGGGEVVVRLVDSTPTPNNRANCGLEELGARMQQHNFRWHAQWDRIRACYRMVEDYERRRGMQFDLIYRMRPDLVFLKRTPQHAIEGWLHQSTNQSNVGQEYMVLMVPPISFARGHMTDWVFTCRRENCAHFFEMISQFEICSSTPAKKEDPCCLFAGDFYNRMQILDGWRPEESVESFPVVLARKAWLDCNRAQGFDELIDLCWKQAQEWNMQTPWVCERNNKVKVSEECPHPI